MFTQTFDSQYYEKTRIFHKKLRIEASTERFLKLLDFKYTEFLTNFVKGS